MRALIFLVAMLTPAFAEPASADDAKVCGSIYSGDYAYAPQEAQLAACNRWLGLGPKTTAERAKILALRARVYSHLGEHEAAIRDLTEVVRLYPSDPNRYFHRAFAHIEAARYGDAKHDIAQALMLKPADAATLSRVGLYYVFMGEFERAVESYSRAIAIQRDRPELYEDRARAHLRMRLWERSLEDINAAIARDPTNLRYLFHRGRTYQAMGDLNRAIEDFTRLSQDPMKGSSGFLGRAGVYQLKGQWTEALADASEMIRLKPAYEPAFLTLLMRARIYKAKGDWERAFSDYALAIASEPNFMVLFQEQTQAWIEHGQLERARKAADAAIRLEPKHPAVLSARAAVRLALGRPDDAIADLDLALKRSPRSSRSLFLRGSAYEAKGDLERALADYNGALKHVHVSGEDVDRIEEKVRARIAALRTASPAGKPGPRLPSAALIGRRVALVVGNGGYRDIARLTNPRNDAKAVAAAFRNLGFADVMEAYDLGLLGMLNALKAFGDRAVGADWAVVYFAGHGLEMGGVNYLIPVDAKLMRDTHVVDEAVTLDRVLDKVSAARHLKLVVLDACRNNPFVARMERIGGAARAIGRGLARTEPDGDVMVVYAAKHGTIAEDGIGANSTLVVALLEHLPTPGLDVRLMFGRVRDSVRKSTNGRQEPFLYGSIGGTEHYFRPAR
jgi:tetratricopeptide (TPR) repeat protein